MRVISDKIIILDNGIKIYDNSIFRLREFANEEKSYNVIVDADTKELEKESERGAVITSEIEMLMELCPGKVIGVTGSDGKTTTTNMIKQVL